jgi:hypothetical protein
MIRVRRCITALLDYLDEAADTVLVCAAAAVLVVLVALSGCAARPAPCDSPIGAIVAQASAAAAEKRIAELCDTTTNGIPAAVEEVRRMVGDSVQVEREERERIAKLARRAAGVATALARNFASVPGVHRAALEAFAAELEMADGAETRLVEAETEGGA